MNESFQEYINILHEMKQLESIGQEKLEIALEDLRLFIIDHRICKPDAVINILEDKIEIKTSENYSTERILEIEEFTGFTMIFKDKGHIIFQYGGQ